MPEPWGQNINKRTFTNSEFQTDILVNYVDTTTLYASQMITAPATTYTVTGADATLAANCLLPGTTFYRDLTAAAATNDTLTTTPVIITAIETSLGQTWNTYESYPVMIVAKNNDASTRTYTINFNADALTITKAGGSSIAIASITTGKTFALRINVMRLSATQILIYT